MAPIARTKAVANHGSRSGLARATTGFGAPGCPVKGSGAHRSVVAATIAPASGRRTGTPRVLASLAVFRSLRLPLSVRVGMVATEIALLALATYLAIDLARQAMQPFAAGAVFASEALPRPIEPRKRLASDYDAITERDIFNPRRSDVAAAIPAPPSPKVKLVGTSPSEDPIRSRAILEDLSTQEQDHRQGMYRVGERFQGWVVAKIEWDRVTLSSGATQYVLTPPFTRDQALRWTGGTVRERVQASDRTYPLSPMMVGGSLGDRGARAFRQAEPVYEAGQLMGLQLLGIRPGSVLATIGLRDGDVVMAFNGSAVTDPAATIDTLAKLGDSDRPHLVVSRGDVTIKLPG